MNDTVAYLNAVGTAVPEHDIHGAFCTWAASTLGEPRDRRAFTRLLARAQIDHRYAVVPFEFFGDTLPNTGARMRAYEDRAFDLAGEAIRGLGNRRVSETTHLIITTCTGFYAPGIDIEIIERFGLDRGVERTIVGFMGCYAALCALKLARHLVRSDVAARVLIVNIELCSMHLQRPADLTHALGLSIFADGCAASIVTAHPEGIALDAFTSTLIAQSTQDITWRIGADGFDMNLSLAVPQKIQDALSANPLRMLDGAKTSDIDVWAIHPGGRAILDAVTGALELPPSALAESRRVLRAYGNMSSATISFVLERILAQRSTLDGARGCGMAFGPGMICETLRFSVAA